MVNSMKISDLFIKRGKAALMPYFTLGYPDYETSLDAIAACAQAGADLMELGIPFSDPLADGPTIQHSMQIALQQGITVQRCLDAVQTLRKRGVEIPLVLMGYINPILAYGLEQFTIEAAHVGASGLIVPDLPPEEAAELQNLCQTHGLDLVFLLPPNCAEARIPLIAQQSQGFIYLVSVMGITGARQTLPVELAGFVERVRFHTDKPLAVGFGISTPQQAAAVGQIADGVIVGSALLRAVGQGSDPVKAAGDFVRALKEALVASS